MGAAGAALAGSIGQGLQARALMQQQGQTQLGQPGQVGVLSPQDITALMRLAGLEVPAGASLTGPVPTSTFNTLLPFIAASQAPPEPQPGPVQPSRDGISPQEVAALMQLAGLSTSEMPLSEPIESSVFNTIFPYIVASQRPAEAAPGATEGLATATPPMLEAGLPERMSVSNWLQARRELQPEEPEPSPFMLTPPDPVAELFGLQTGQPISAANLSQVGTIAEDLANAGILPQPKPEPLFYYTVQADDPSRYGQLIDFYPDLQPGQKIPYEQAEAMVSFAERLMELEGQAVDVQKKALELKKAQYQWENSLVPVESAERTYYNAGLTGVPIIRDVDGDGKVLWEDFLADNKDLQQLVQGAQEIKRLVELTEGIRLDNVIKEADAVLAPQRTQLALRQLAAEVQIEEERARHIVDELRLDRERTQAETNRLLQQVEQGKTMFEADLELRREQIKQARAEGRLTEQEAQAAEHIAGLQALLLEYEVQKAQMAVDPVQAEALWITLGLDGEYSPSGVKLYRGNVEPMLSFMEANAGKVITARDLFTAAGIDPKQIPEQALEQLIPINEHTLGVVRTVTGVEPEEEDITDSLDLILKLSQLFSPYLSSNLNAQILLATGFARTNPEAAANLLKSPGANLAEQMDQLMPGSGEVINQVLDSLLRQAAGQLGVATGAAGPTVQSYAQEMVARAGSAQRAYRDAIQYKEILLADESSPLYQNEAAYEQFLAVLRSMAEGR